MAITLSPPDVVDILRMGGQVIMSFRNDFAALARVKSARLDYERINLFSICNRYG